VVGFNNVSLARVMSVPLTTIASPMQELGAAAATALLELMAGGRPTSQVMPVELLVRASTGGPGPSPEPNLPLDV
jgi:LacI family transcriptional regulator